MHSRLQQPNQIWGLLFLVGFACCIVMLAFLLDPRHDSSAVATLRSTKTFNVGLLSPRTSAKQPVTTTVSIAMLESLAIRYGWEVQYTRYDSLNDLIEGLEQGEVTVVADMVIDHRVPHAIRFSDPYDQATPVVVYFPRRTKKVASLEAVPSNAMLVINDSWQERYLQREALSIEGLSWQELPDYFELQDIIAGISGDLGGYTLVLEREYHPLSFIDTGLAIALYLDPVDLGLAFRADDIELEQLAGRFIRTWLAQQESTTPVQPRINRTDLRVFLRMIQTRLPRYADVFIEAGKTYNLDWRLIAAIAYQESLWDEKARSPTGVRGLMMLTQSTAASLQVTNRIDPQQSVFGGVRYFLSLRDRMPRRIAEPDRSWFALAAYNLGFAHLEEIRKHAQQQGKNPDKWEDVAGYLHLLEDPHWYTTSRYGFARGNEAKTYVANIRKYFEVLLHLRESDEDLQATANPSKMTTQKISATPVLTLPTRISPKY